MVQIDHQKICMTESGYNQILVIIDHFTKLAEAVPCQTASAEETCDHFITQLDIRILYITQLDITIWLSNDFSVRQRKSLCGGLDKRIDEEVTHCSSALDNLPSSDERAGRETE